MNCAGLIYDASKHYLDHLAPFCSLLDWPLIALDDEIADMAKHFYPDLKVIQTAPPSTIVTCDTKPFLNLAFPQKSFRTLWLSHGNSDKKISSEYLEQEDYLLVYGPKMAALLGRGVEVGNFRHLYYQKKRKRIFFHLPEKGPLFLYAPTWDDFEKNCSFWTAFPLLAQNLPDDTHLLIKLHPNTFRVFAPEIEILKGRYLKKNIHFLPDISPIYPLLAKCDALITDMSSVGYDFLQTGKPLFFLNANPSHPLHEVGASIHPQTFHFKLTHQNPTSKQKLYDQTFGSLLSKAELKKRIYESCRL